MPPTSLLTSPALIDIRTQLPHKTWEIGRRTATTSLTLHFNGGRVSADRLSGAGCIQQLVGDTRWQMRPGGLGAPQGGDGLQYHRVFDGAGTEYITRDDDALLWHCGHPDGNMYGLAFHLPLGQDPGGQNAQAPTDAQWQRVTAAIERECARYSIPRNRVFAHLEWKHATECPGVLLYPLLLAWRNGPVLPPAPLVYPPGITRYRVLSTLTTYANVRQAPTRQAVIAGTLKPGGIILVDAVKRGETVDGDNRWVHMARVEHEQGDLGFVSMTLLEAL